MTDTEIRIAIADVCGRNGWWCPQCKKLVSELSLGYQNRHANCSESARQMPNYPNDLNAMHDLEDWLLTHTDLSGDYCTNLQGLLDCNCTWEIVHATPRQRAEAFLRTMGKWQQKPPATQPGIEPNNL